MAWHAWRRPGCRGGAASRRWPGRAPACVGHAPVPAGARRKVTGGGGSGDGLGRAAGPGGLPGERQVVLLSLSISVFIYLCCSVLF